ncbi:hypothetical protein YDYSY3_37100 [Paenibacillus chitinolyticus]|nr:hypothetical protein YDYSY3_37100 [Paenibacillus chitinolyticus]
MTFYPIAKTRKYAACAEKKGRAIQTIRGYPGENDKKVRELLQAL